MTKVKILGAGSIGNHLAHAARRLGWEVDVCDVDSDALTRMKTEIYPARYGHWDEGIRLFSRSNAPQGGYDFVFVGTPPESHMELALEALVERPRAITIEKPLCTPALENVEELQRRSRELNIPVFVGYDHVVGKASRQARELLSDGAIGQVQTIDVEFREHWEGIFAAHPWLFGPEDTYLGFWRRGGGASGEHSHAANLWQHLAHSVGAGRVTEVSSLLRYETMGEAEYDSLCLMNLRTESGLVGRVVQDVVTRPSRKWARVQGKNGYVEIWLGVKPGTDTVTWRIGENSPEELTIKKTRPDDFIEELTHLHDVVSKGLDSSPLALNYGLETILVVAAAHRSAQKRKSVRIDYERGYRFEALD